MAGDEQDGMLDVCKGEVSEGSDMEEDSEAPPLPPKPRLSRPRITIPSITIPYSYSPHTAMTAGCAVPIGNTNGPFGLLNMYPSKASEFMFKRYEGFRDFTRNTAKSGLSFGEKWMFWLYGRIRGLSKRWFTHIFLFLVVFGYSLLGGFLFVTVEGSHEDAERANISHEYAKMQEEVRKMSLNTDLVLNHEEWERRFLKVFKPFEEQLLESFNHGVTPRETKRWTFWNSVFYSGTIYTTIDILRAILPCQMPICRPTHCLTAVHKVGPKDGSK